MLSLPDDVAVAPVDAFLTAVDNAMNSNTLLLKVRLDSPVLPGNCIQVLARLIRAPLFTQMIRHADLERGWGNLQVGGSPVLDGAVVEVRELSEAGFAGRLRWMLREAFSPYQQHCSEQHAGELVHGFLAWLHAVDAAQPESGSWSYGDVRPMFLRSTGYYADTPCPCGAAYFDGGDSDTATLIYRGNVMLLLLTNGSP